MYVCFIFFTLQNHVCLAWNTSKPFSIFIMLGEIYSLYTRAGQKVSSINTTRWREGIIRLCLRKHMQRINRHLSVPKPRLYCNWFVSNCQLKVSLQWKVLSRKKCDMRLFYETKKNKGVIYIVKSVQWKHRQQRCL